MIVSNAQLTLEIAPASGEIIRFEYLGRPLVKALGDGELFHLLLRDGEGKAHSVRNTDFPRPALIAERRGDTQWLFLDYAGGELLPEFSVRVSLRMPDDSPACHWRISYAGLAEQWYCDWIDFPRIRLKDDLEGSGGEARFFWPGAEGGEFVEFHTWKKTFPTGILQYPLTGIGGYYPGPCPMQFQAYYRPDAGFYFATHDDTHAPKGIDVDYDENGTIRPYFQLFTGSRHPESYTLPFEVTTAGFEGDWQDAALIYRRWMENHDLGLPMKLENNPDVPAWLKDSPVVLAYPVRGSGKDTGSLEGNEYFPYDKGLPMVKRYREAWDSPIMALLMHWEGTAPWAPPYVWPPFGGAEMLAGFADKLHADGNLLGVYCSGTAWTQTSSIDPRYDRTEQFEREHLACEMCVGPEGEMFAKVCNGEPGKGQRIGYEACVDRKWTRDTVSGEIGKIITAGVDYLQFFDQNQGCTAPLCYSREHGHPDAPGAWLTRAMESLLDASAQVVRDSGKQVVLGCENGAAEPYIKNLQLNDLRNHLNWCYAKPVPAYAMLFHEYVNNFMGNGVCLGFWFDREKSPEFIQYRTAYSFVSGDVLSALMKDNGEMHWAWVCEWSETPPDQEALTRLIGNLNAMRRGRGKDYLVFGRMEKDLPVECGRWTLHFTNGREPIELPTVLSSHWSYGNDEAEILANFRKEPARATLKFDRERSGSWYVGSAAEGCEFSGRELTLEIPPLSAVLVEFD